MPVQLSQVKEQSPIRLLVRISLPFFHEPTIYLANKAIKKGPLRGRGIKKG